MKIPNAILPYSDELLIWDDASQKYYLTEESLIREGIDIRGRLARNKANSPEYVLNGFIKRVTSVVYAFIHKGQSRTDLQDYFIAVCPSLREKIRLALTNQALYMVRQGDLLLSIHEEERRNNMDSVAVDILNTKVEEINNPITYKGEWVFYD
jgi:hypothetical protein